MTNPIQASRTRMDSHSIVSLLLSGLSLLSLFVFYPVAPVPAIAALISGITGVRRSREVKAFHIVACVVGGLILLLSAAALLGLLSMSNSITEGPVTPG